MDEQLRQVLEEQPCGLMTDIDGTISPIAPTPDAAFVTPAAREQLATLATRLDVVAAITGRGAADAARLVGLPQLLYIGNHGLETWQHGQAHPLPEAQPFVAPLRTMLQQAQARITTPSVLFENKGVSASVHYRQTTDPAAAEAELGTVLQALADEHGLRLTRGQMVWEIRPPLAVDKGAAVRRIVAQYGLRSAIFIGDDRTDADGFAALHELRAAGTCVTLAIGVDSPGTPAVVRETADLLVAGVTGVEQLLAHMVAMV